MFTTPFSYLICQKREALGLNKASAADLVDMSPRRWSHIERGTRTPSPREVELISAALSIPTAPARPVGLATNLCVKGGIHLPVEPFYHPRQERPSHVRYGAALQKHPQFVRELTTVIKERSDFAECEYFCQHLALGSYAEVLYLLRLLACGLQPRLVVPGTIRRTPHPLADPESRTLVCHRPHLCLIGEAAYYFCQVSLLTPRIYTVDFFRFQGGLWTAIEIDGEGHDATCDPERTAALRIPVLRLRPSQIVSKDFEL